jgi:hypothetical protein
MTMIESTRLKATRPLVKQSAAVLGRMRMNLACLVLTAVIACLMASAMSAGSFHPYIASASPAGARAISASYLQEQASPAIAEQEEHGLPHEAVEVGRISGFPITNSMIVSWIVALGLILFAQFATRNMKRVPEGAQNFA